MPRKSRRRIMGKQEDASQREREEQLAELERELHRQQNRSKTIEHAEPPHSSDEIDE